MENAAEVPAPPEVVATEEIKPKTEIQRVVPSAIAVDPRTQLIMARDNGEVVRLIRTMMKGQALPKTLDSEEKLVMAWQAAASLKVPPTVAISNMAIINGVLSIWGQLPKALAHATGEMRDFDIQPINDKQEVIALKYKNLDTEIWGAVIGIKRGGQTKNEYFFTMKDAERAGLDKKKGPWQDYRGIMIMRRTIAWGVKVEFPDALMGLSIAEYDLHEAPDLKDVTPMPSTTGRADQLNSQFSKP